MPKYWALGAALTASIGWSLVVTAAELPDEYAKLIQEHSRIATLDGGFFGDHVGLSTGSLEFVQTDIDLRGNNALQVRVGRQFEPGRFPARGHFGDWDLDIPHIHGVFGGLRPDNVAWISDEFDENRCSKFSAPPEMSTINGGHFSPDEYWHGTSLYLPGSGDQELLYPGGIDVPATGGPYHAATRDGAVARCLSALAPTSEAASGGEGFEVVTPDGVTYTFDQMVRRYADALHKSDPTPLMRPGKGRSKGQTVAVNYNLSRNEFILFPTKVTDRFGNTVTYTWSSSNPWRLTDIVASDGRQLHLTYSASDPDSYVVQTVSDGTHVWNYAYASTVAYDTLTSVTQPDGGVWQFNLYDMYRDSPHPSGVLCDTMGTPGSGVVNGTIAAPSGATATYTLTGTIFGRSWGVRECYGDPAIPLEPYLFSSAALTLKKITGPGLPSSGITWGYSYGPPNNCWSHADPGMSASIQCTSSSPTTRTTTVTGPDGSVSRYTFGNRFMDNEGMLLTEEHGLYAGTAARTTTYDYGEGDAAPYGMHQGGSLRRRGDWIVTSQRRPQKTVTTTQQGQQFVWSVPQACSGNYCFDTNARPTTVVRTGPNAPARTEVTTYYDDTTHWVIGQVAQVKCTAPTIGLPAGCGASGTVMSATTYDAATALPLTTSAFGKLKNTFTYDTTSSVPSGLRGTLTTAKDGNNNVTTYSGWVRGIPQTVHFPATPESPSGATRTAVVNGFGWIDSVTDENGFTTSYLYDAMGRITNVTYPADSGVTWHSTSSAFQWVGSAENGVAAGHWRETVQTGNGVKVTIFDALWRPVLVHEYDSGASGTDRYVATAYDNAGRVADASYPMGSAPTMLYTGRWQFGTTRPNGVQTYYDTLGRPVSVQQDSELGVLSTNTDYLAGFQRRVTDARNHATTETFMAWDSPTFDLPIRIDAPEGQSTTITRDIFGKPTSIARGGAQ